MNFYNTFSKTAQNFSNNIALSGNNYSLTYEDFLKEIDDLSASLPDYLRASCAAIILPRKKEIISWQLALNSKNLSFSCLDSSQPFARLEQMIVQLRPSIVVCEKTNLKLINWCTSNSMEPLLIGHSDTDVDNQEIAFVRSHNYRAYHEKCKYIVFSSGSTGNPKAIMLSDDGAVNTIKSQIKEFNIAPEDNVLWALNPAFDASLSDIYTALFSGAKLCIYKQELSKIKTLVDFLNTNQISVADLPPSILPYIDLDILKHLKTIIFGGEVANEEIILKHSKNANMFNVYGPTETSICASFCRVTDSWTSSCIGQPLDGFSFSINKDSGELVISSTQGHIALGYLDLDELTKSKFINNKSHNSNALKGFNTADAASFDGTNYFYLGRLDRQFKHLGNLISPEEIEKVALKFSSITHAQVKYDQQKHAIILNACLKQFRLGTAIEGMDLITNPEYNEDMKLELKRHLKIALPSFMQPSLINFVSLKTNNNNKVSL